MDRSPVASLQDAAAWEKEQLDLGHPGPISEVLAKARASLKEPSRPFTPAHRVLERSASLPQVGSAARLVRACGSRAMLREPMPTHPTTTSNQEEEGEQDACERVDQQGLESESGAMMTPRASSSYVGAETWRTEVVSLLQAIGLGMRQENWIRVERSLESLHGHPLDVLLSKSALPSGGEAEQATRLREEALSVLLTTMRRAPLGSRMRAANSAIKVLRADMTRPLQPPPSPSPSTSRSPQGGRGQETTKTLKKLDEAWQAVFLISTDPAHDASFSSPDVLGSILSFLGTDAEMLLRMAAESVSAGTSEADDTVACILQPLIHAAGAMRHLSGNATHNARMGREGAIHTCAKLLSCCHLLLSPPPPTPKKQGPSTALRRSQSHASGVSRRGEKSSAGSGREGLSEEVCEEVVRLLVQVTASLRNLCMDKACHRQVLACNLPSALLSLIRPLSDRPEHRELMLNITRVLSKLSLYEGIRASINEDPAHLRDLLHLLEACTRGGTHVYAELLREHTTATVSRAAFILGNLTASNNNNRRLLGLRLKGVEVVVELVEIVGSMYLAMKEGQDGCSSRRKSRQAADQSGDEDSESSEEEGEDEDGMCGQLEEMLIKLVRLCANLSVDEEVGKKVAKADGIETLLSLLRYCIENLCPAANRDESGDGSANETSNEVQRPQGYQRGEELLLNTVSALANLSFYLNEEDQLYPLRNEACLYLYDVLLHDHEEAIAEAARAFGNLSRDPQVREMMAATKADRALVYLLDHQSRDVVTVVIGALVNITADPANQAGLFGEDLELGRKLVRLLRRSGLRDLELSTLTCKAVYNYYLRVEKGGLGEEGDDETRQMLASTLEELIDTAREVEGSGGARMSAMYNQFLDVAETVQKRLSGTATPMSSPPRSSRSVRGGTTKRDAASGGKGKVEGMRCDGRVQPWAREETKEAV